MILMCNFVMKFPHQLYSWAKLMDMLETVYHASDNIIEQIVLQ